MILGIWRHLVKHIPLKPRSQLWSIVFLLGMYTLSTERLADVLKLDFLHIIPATAIYIATAARALTKSIP